VLALSPSQWLIGLTQLIEFICVDGAIEVEAKEKGSRVERGPVEEGVLPGGGIGVINILLVSVTERTREIGLRMAIGARRLHVLLQFLTEAIFLSVTGGVTGIAARVIVSVLISVVAHWPTQLSAVAIATGFLFSGAVGVFSAITRREWPRGSTQSKRFVTNSRGYIWHVLRLLPSCAM